MTNNQLFAIGYVVFGVFSMIAFSFMADNFFMGVVTGLLLILGAALAHEYTLRRDGFAKVVRGVIGLRETADRAEGAVTRMKAEFDKTVNDVRAVREALGQIQQLEEKVNALSEQAGQGGGADGEVISQMQDGMHQLYAQQQQANEDIAVIQNAGNQLYEEFQAIQQQLAALQQQMQQLSAGGIAPATAAPPPPPPPSAAPEAAAPAPAPEPIAPAIAEPAPEMAAAVAEQAPVAAPAAPAAGGSDFSAQVFQGLEAQMASLGDSPADAVLRAVGEGLLADAVDLYAETIVTLPERRPTFMECYGGVRGADGNPLMIDPELDMSGREGVMTIIENALMMRCLDRIEALDVSGLEGGKCFYNVPGMTLADRTFFGGLLGHLQNRPGLAGRLVMEFTQGGLMEHGELAVEDLVRMQEVGCMFSIDEITDLAIDFESLVGFGFRFAKVGSKFIRVQANSADDPESVRGLAGNLKAMGIDLIVENVETDLSLVELIAFEIGYGQGGLFGQPAVV